MSHTSHSPSPSSARIYQKPLYNPDHLRAIMLIMGKSRNIFIQIKKKDLPFTLKGLEIVRFLLGKIILVQLRWFDTHIMLWVSEF